MKNVHQGDVFLEEIAELPSGPQRIVRKGAVAYGEVTGHAHRIEGCEIVEIGGMEFLVQKEAAPMSHEEHPTVPVHKAIFKVRIQQEYFPEGNQDVAD